MGDLPAIPRGERASVPRLVPAAIAPGAGGVFSGIGPGRAGRARMALRAAPDGAAGRSTTPALARERGACTPYRLRRLPGSDSPVPATKRRSPAPALRPFDELAPDARIFPARVRHRPSASRGCPRCFPAPRSRARIRDRRARAGLWPRGTPIVRPSAASGRLFLLRDVAGRRLIERGAALCSMWILGHPRRRVPCAGLIADKLCPARPPRYSIASYTLV